MRKAVLLFAVVAVAAFVVYLWPDDSGRDSEAAAPTVERESAEGVRREEPLQATEPVARPAEETPAARTLVEQGEPQPVATGQPEQPTEREVEPPLEDGIEVLVVVQETGAAVPHADVHFLDPRSFAMEEAMMEMQVEGLDFEKLLRTFGRRFRADADGRLLVPRGGDEPLIAASKGVLFGMTQIENGMEEPIRLEVAPDPSVEVHVRDTLGNPIAGVPVALRMKHEERFGGIPALNKVVTDASGKAVITRFGKILEEITADQDGWVPYVAITAMLPAAVEQEIDPDNLPTEPVVLVMPPTGEVEVLLVDPGGEPFAKPAFVALTPATDDENERARALAMFTAGATVMAEDGRALFEFVGLGQELAVTAGTMETNEPAEDLIAGPTSAGQRVTLTMTVASDAPILVARILDGEGEPLAETVVQVAIRRERAGGGSGSQSSGLRTDEEGVLRMPVRDDELEPGDSRKVTFTANPDGEVELGARLDLGWTLPPGDTDLGDVVLVTKPLIASGSVTDQDNAPVAGANVRLHQVGWEDPDGGEVHWTPVWQLRTTSQGDGSFAVHGWIEAERLAVSAEHASFRRGEEIEIRTGTEGVHLELFGAGRIAGRLLLDPGIDVGRHVQLDLRDRADEPVDTQSRNERNGSFELRQVPPGVWSLSIRAGRNELLHIDGIHVRSGETTEIDDVDLRGRLHRIGIDVVDVDGEALSNARVLWRPAGDEAAEQQLDQAWGGSIEIVSEHAALDLEVSTAGHRTDELQGVDSDRTVVLQPGPRVRLVLSGDLPALGPEHSLRAGLRPVGQTGHVVSTQATFQPGGQATLALSEPGPYRLRLTLFHRVGNRSSSRTVQGFPQTTIEVADTSGEQVFEIDLGGADFAQTIELLGAD